MASPIEQLNEAIAQKKEELKELLFARESLQELAHAMGGTALAITVSLDGKPLQLAETVDAESTPTPAPTADKVDRRKTIADRVESKPASRSKRAHKKGPGGRRIFSPEFKLEVLEAMDAGDKTQAEICKKFGIYPSNIITWQRQKEDGTLNPSPREPEVSSLELPEAQDDTPPEEASPPFVGKMSSTRMTTQPW